MSQEKPVAAAPEGEELNQSEREVLDLIRARYSLIYVVSSEEARVEAIDVRQDAARTHIVGMLTSFGLMPS